MFELTISGIRVRLDKAQLPAVLAQHGVSAALAADTMKRCESHPGTVFAVGEAEVMAEAPQSGKERSCAQCRYFIATTASKREGHCPYLIRSMKIGYPVKTVIVPESGSASTCEGFSER